MMMPISMNLSSERKHSMKPLLAAISLVLAVVSPAFAGIEWGFDNGNLSSAATGGPGNATITVGAYATGWHSGATLPWNTYGGATGFWDLGSAGSILLTGLSGSGPVTLNVFQWVDPASPYSGNSLSFTAGNGNSGDFTQVGDAIGGSLGQPGAWWEYAANLGVLTPGETITVSAGSGGAIIDRLTLVPEPATLIAGAILLIPFALSTWPILRRRRKS
jgi:hypothetical protein